MAQECRVSVSNEDVSLDFKPVADESKIGIILMRAGRLKKEDVARIVTSQRQNGLRFGDAAIKLGLLEERDVRSALARQFDYSYITHGDSRISRDVIAAYEPSSPAAEAVRALRSQLMMRWFDANNPAHNAVAITGPERGVGRSWLAANLAVAFAQLGKSTVLVDGDLRDPRQHQLFGVDNHAGLAQLLCNRARLQDVLQRNKVLPHLTVLPSGSMPPNPQEIIARGGFVRLLGELRGAAEVIIVDTPAESEGCDGRIIASRVGCALVVSRQHQSSAVQLANYFAALGDAGVTVLLTVVTQ
jgi:receptor protein-tyrosine kinase